MANGFSEHQSANSAPLIRVIGNEKLLVQGVPSATRLYKSPLEMANFFAFFCAKKRSVEIDTFWVS